MCGRYTVHTSLQVIADLFEIAEPSHLIPRYNVAPSQDVPVVRLFGDSQRELVMMRFGLVPYWAKDPKIGYKLINARSETLLEKPSFREAFKKRRCLIVADGFYEWKKSADTKQPYWIHLKSKEPFAFAGLWEYWRAEDGAREITSCSIITTEANEFVSDFHDRMPAILPKAAYAPWLDTKNNDVTALKKWLRPLDGSLMGARAVSTVVNSPRNDDPSCLLPASDMGDFSAS